MSNAHVTFDFTDTHVLVTGGTSGIGYAIATAFVKAGAHVTVTGTRASTLDYDVDLSAFTYRQLQVTDKDAINALAASLQKLDILINNAGASFPGGKSEWEPDVFAQALDINLMSAFRLSHACKPLLEKSELPGGASIINISSMSGIMAVEMVPGYGTAKAGIIQMTRSLGQAWARNNIRTNAIAPGLIQTRMTKGFADDPEICKPILKRTPLRRTGTSEEIADVVLFVCSGSASFIVGQTINVDGGYSVVG
jgi:3-oxoacyl-[acyl-carrier protein] reductase